MTKILRFFTILLILGLAVCAKAGSDEVFFLGHKLHQYSQGNFPSVPELPITPELITKLRVLNSSGQVLNAWKLLATQQDGYAISAVKIFGSEITVGKCTVEGNWVLVIGKEKFNQFFKPYAQYYQRSYIEFLAKNQRYPQTVEIENLYRRANDAFGLPQSVSVDLMLNLIPDDWLLRKALDVVGTLAGEGRPAYNKRWYHYTELSKSRYSTQFITADDVDVEQAKELYLTNSKQVALCMAAKLKFWE